MAAYKLAGIYVIRFGDCVYIGQSLNIHRRPTVDLAKRLGLDWSVVVEFLPGTSQ